MSADRDQGSFINGFSLGLFAGAAAYFMFGTENGAKFRKQVTKEWAEARANMPDRGDGLTNFATIRELLLHMKNHIDESVTKAEHKVEAQKAKKKAVAAGTVPKKPAKFKGTWKKIKI